jgi:hypothetical protein
LAGRFGWRRGPDSILRLIGKWNKSAGFMVDREQSGKYMVCILGKRLLRKQSRKSGVLSSSGGLFGGLTFTGTLS